MEWLPMASRVDEGGYEQNGNMRQREPYRGQNYDEEQRSSGRNRRRDERDFDLAREDMREERHDERRASRFYDEAPPARAASALSDAFVSAFERGAQVLGENMRMYQDETVRFVTERLEHDTQMLERLGKSRSMFDLLALQQQWFNATTRAYSDEWMRLSKLTADATQRSAQETRRTARETRASMDEARRFGYDAE
jgi:hypothetical protein